MANPWFALYAGDFDAKTAHLTMVEDGAYNRLLRQYYRTGKPLPANAEVLLRVCRSFADDEKAATLKVLQEFFVLEEDGWHNKRADEELEKSSQISEKRRDAGKRGAAKTNMAKSANAAPNAEILPTRLPTQPQPQPQSHINTPPNPLKEGEPKKRKRRSKAQILEPYPEQVGKLVNHFSSVWPEVQPADKSPITIDTPKLAERMDVLLREPNVTAEILMQSAEMYLAEPKRFYKHPQFFFGVGNGESAHWTTYARMTVHQQSRAAVTQ